MGGWLFRSPLANNLNHDFTSRRVGDIISVTLSGNTQASKSADTSTAKDSNGNLNPITGLAGQAINIGGESVQLGISSSRDFSGDATANQSNSLNGAISVTVVDVLPNSNLVIRGEK